MKLKILSSLFLAVTLLFSAQEAKSAEIFRNSTPNGSCAIAFFGDIEVGDDSMFAALSSHCNEGGVLFQSSGGKLVAGLRIGELIRERGLETAVSYESMCTSACALAWLGGVKRHMFTTSRIGFHAAYTSKGKETLESGVGNALVGAYMTKLGLPRNAIIFATSAKPTSMSWLDIREAQSLGINVQKLTDKDREWIENLADYPHRTK